MVATPRAGETLREIAGRYGREYQTLRTEWSRHPSWPEPIGRGPHGAHLYDSAAVDAMVAAHFTREAVTLEPSRLYTAKEIEAATGIKPATIRADVNKGRWPAPDDTTSRANRWLGTTVTEAVAKRRGYRASGTTTPE
ncbi:helix-turn-helix transcriptional regulator [Streptomyces lavendulae]|uniref:helix-turn-helix transcriptional regulator n=1 Tax=Streptomyces lavendulae TaxID=1914 RepID=UPI0036EC8C16